MVLHVTGAHAHAFANGALTLLFEQTKDFEPRWIGNSFKHVDKAFVRKRSHID
jgi:hypothetical protein